MLNYFITYGRQMENSDSLFELLKKDSRGRTILKTIGKSGSIAKTSKLLNLSYKTVWNYVTRINNTFRGKIVETKIGGKENGGAYLTDLGKDILKLLDELEANTDKLIFLTGLDEAKLKNLLGRYSVRTSARNQIPGKVTRIKRGMISAEVEVKTKGGEILTALITMDSLKTLGIQEGSDVFLLIKATWVIIGQEEGIKLSARNIIPTTVKKVVKGLVNSEVILETDGETQITSVITNESAESLGLKPGKRVKAIFKASHVIVGI